jgi:hypothetical protein
MHRVQLSIGKDCPDATLFRNNTGSAWQGERRQNPDGSITLYNPRPIKFGLCLGGSDLIGWTKVLITPDMVGKHIAVFTAVECKTSKGVAKNAQLNFISVIKQAGGKAGIAKTPEQGVEVIRN